MELDGICETIAVRARGQLARRDSLRFFFDVASTRDRLKRPRNSILPLRVINSRKHSSHRAHGLPYVSSPLQPVRAQSYLELTSLASLPNTASRRLVQSFIIELSTMNLMKYFNVGSAGSSLPNLPTATWQPDFSHQTTSMVTKNSSCFTLPRYASRPLMCSLEPLRQSRSRCCSCLVRLINERRVYICALRHMHAHTPSSITNIIGSRVNAP